MWYPSIISSNVLEFLSPMNIELSSSLQFLPSPRSISVSIHTDEFRPHDHLMVISAIWGEFVHHDVSHTPQARRTNFAIEEGLGKGGFQI